MSILNVDPVSLILSVLAITDYCYRVHRAPSELKNYIDNLNNTSALLDTVRSSLDSLAGELPYASRQSAEDVIRRVEIALAEAKGVVHKSRGSNAVTRLRLKNKLRWVLKDKATAEMNQNIMLQLHSSLEATNMKLAMESFVREVRSLLENFMRELRNLPSLAPSPWLQTARGPRILMYDGTQRPRLSRNHYLESQRESFLPSSVPIATFPACSTLRNQSVSVHDWLFRSSVRHICQQGKELSG